MVLFSFIQCYLCLSSNSNFTYLPLFPEASDISFYVNACFVIEVPNYSESRGVSNLAPVLVEIDTKPKAKPNAKPKAKPKKRKSEDSDGSQQQSTKKKKEEKKAKDPNAPKRNISAFMHYSKDSREGLKASQPELTFGEIAKAMSVNWKALSVQERAVWDKKATVDKERYQQDMAQYKDSDQYAKWQAKQMEETKIESNSKKKPKRNISAFMHYSKDSREGLKASQPELTFGEIAEAMSVNWKALTDQQRALWNETAAADKERYQRELAEYQNSQSTAQDVDETKMPAKKN